MLLSCLLDWVGRNYARHVWKSALKFMNNENIEREIAIDWQKSCDLCPLGAMDAPTKVCRVVIYI